MEWLLRSPQIHSTFSNLGHVHGDGYQINENCNAVLETILQNILSEEKYLRKYRRSISFGQHIDKDLIPLLLHAKDDTTIDLLIRILVNLTIPIECLLSVDLITKTEFGRHTVFEINNLLASTKVAFTDLRVTKVIIDFLKKNLDLERKSSLSSSQCTNISNSLLLLRNVLHIPEELTNNSTNHNGFTHAVQNQILWNIFSHSIDKVLIKLMIIPDACKWAVTMVQLIALLYKDQHVTNLHKLLNLWLETSTTESSDDNESNTTPPGRGSQHSSPMDLTSDPTSDSSDTGASGKINGENNTANKSWEAPSEANNTKDCSSQQPKLSNEKKKEEEKSNCSESSNQDVMKTDENDKACSSGIDDPDKDDSGQSSSKASYNKRKMVSETSDCGYGTQIENQESISTSSNEEEVPTKKPRHQKPHNPKPKPINNPQADTTAQEPKRKKIVKRGKSNIINVQGLSHKTPTDEDISNVLKEFTVDFLLKGYNALVETLHSQILNNLQLELDKSHFFWLVTYFLKFATQIELDLDHVCSILSFDIISYLTAEGVNLCEQFELAVRLGANDLKSNGRRLHLVVTALRELIQAIEVYKRSTHLSKDDQDALIRLQIKMCEAEELRCLMVLLLHHYDAKHLSKQYLQDLIVTNHLLLMLLDSAIKLPEYKGSTNMVDHIKLFATNEIMYQYGSLLEDYLSNGEFVNDCIFTIMHHVGGELDSLITLFQPHILKTFTSIWKSDFAIGDDWSDLIEYVINTFVKKPNALKTTINVPLDAESFDGDRDMVDHGFSRRSRENAFDNAPRPDKWTEDEKSSLSWNYIQCSSLPDLVGEIIKLYNEDGAVKSRHSVINQLFAQNVINKDEYERLLRSENNKNTKKVQVSTDMRDNEIGELCEQLAQDGKSACLDWVQRVLLETCFAKIYVEKKRKRGDNEFFQIGDKVETKFQSKQADDLEVVSPVSYHSLLFQQSVSLVPWSCKQADICKDLNFIQLLHKLGFHMPVDSGKVFIRIPNFWTADFLYDVAGKISEIDNTTLKFPVKDIFHSTTTAFPFIPDTTNLLKDITMAEPPNNYQIHKQTHLGTMVNYTPTPGSFFKSDDVPCDVPKQSWLDMVKKSQDYDLSQLNMSSRPMEEECDVQGGVVTSLLVEAKLASEAIPKVPSPIPGPSSMFHANPYTRESSPFPGTTALLGTANSFPSRTTSFPMSDLIMPTIMSAKQEVSAFRVQPDMDHSACETASVASNLTRMYVSDEDDKSEVFVPPVIKHLDDQLSVGSDNIDCGTSPRIEYFSPF